MKIGVISDIHGNLEALEKVIKELKGIDKIVCLGDIVGYGVNPNECCEIVREISDVIISGNHDLATIGDKSIKYFNSYAVKAILWTQKVLSKENYKFLSELKQEEYLHNIALVHGSLFDYSAYIISSEDAQLNFLYQQTPLCLIGHTHISEYYFKKNNVIFIEQVSLFSGGEIEIKEEHSYIINCGSVGQPRDKNPKASFGIYDTEKKIFKVERVDYPIEITSKKIEKAGLPKVLSERLFIGF